MWSAIIFSKDEHALEANVDFPLPHCIVYRKGSHCMGDGENLVARKPNQSLFGDVCMCVKKC